MALSPMEATSFCSNVRSTGGAGLGLSLVAAVASLHGGSLNFADNHPGLRAALTLGGREPLASGA